MTGKLAVKRAEALRGRATHAERALCRLLDDERISYVFQAPMWKVKTGRMFIADFRIKRPSTKDHKRLFVEVDGGYHQDRTEYDAYRTQWMERHRNAIVLRFTNEDVFNQPEKVLAAINGYGPSRKTVHRSRTSRA